MSDSNTYDILGIIVRLLGLVVLIIDLTVALKVIIEVWDLYKEPNNIERFAIAIEQGSGLDSLINNFSKQTNNSDTENTTSQTEIRVQQQSSLRLTYFVAWIIVILLLMVIGGIGMSAIRTGGQLALYDLQVKRFARQVLNEAQKK